MVKLEAVDNEMMNSLADSYYEVTEIMDNLRVSMKKLSKCDRNPFRKVDFRMLHLIKDTEELTMQELGEEMGITKSRVTAIVSKLMEKDLVITETSQKDKRKKFLRLTKKGEKQIEDFKRSHEEFFMKMWNHYTDEEVAQWKHLMTKMTTIIEEEIKNFEKLEQSRKENKDEII